MSNEIYFDKNNNDWLQKRKDKELVFDQEEYLRQNQNRIAVSDRDSAVEFVGEIISRAIADLKPIKKKIRRNKIAETIRIREDAYDFLFVGDRLDDFLFYWGYNITADLLRTKIKRNYSFLNMPHMQLIRQVANFSILPLEKIGKK